MRNRWRVEKNPLIGWYAGIDEALLGDAIRLGEACGVYRVLTAPDLGYDRAAARRTYPDFLSESGLSDDREHLAAARSVSALVAFVEHDGDVVERETADLGRLLAGDPRMNAWPSRSALELMPIRSGRRMELTIMSCSDIWLPWCWAGYEAGVRAGELADNRELADRHTPRLNEFLARIGELAESCGRGLELADDATSPEFLFEVTDRGVLLDALPPEHLRV